MKSLWLVFLLAGPVPASTFEGRWDLTIKTAKDTYPSWLEFNGSEARVVGRVASVHPATDVKVAGQRLTFSTTEWFGKDMKVSWAFSLAGQNLTGTQTREDGTRGTITGAPAPSLRRPPPSKWSPPVPLFDGKTTQGWEPLNTEPGKPPESHWKVIGGELVNESPGANIRTTRRFGDFKLHVEYNCPDDGNSGVYLRGRYEIQVAYEKSNDALHGMGALYGFLAPEANVAAKPGQWESYDVTLFGRTLTVIRDGVTTIDRREIPGITGGALDSHEAEPGPIYIQGDHTGGMKYRNITISVPAAAGVTASR